MKWARLLEAAADVEAVAGVRALTALADGIGEGQPRTSLLALRSDPGFTEAAAAVLEAIAVDGLPGEAAAASLHGLAAGCTQRDQEQEVSLVWSGPSSHRVPVRSTSRVLLGLIATARQELTLMTYSARRYEPLVAALQEAVAQGVHVDVVVETLKALAARCRKSAGIRLRGCHRGADLALAVRQQEGSRGQDPCEAGGG